MKARHKKELKALDGTGRKLIKQANKNKKKVAEAEAKIAQVRGSRRFAFPAAVLAETRACGVMFRCSSQACSCVVDVQQALSLIPCLRASCPCCR